MRLPSIEKKNKFSNKISASTYSDLCYEIIFMGIQELFHQ